MKINAFARAYIECALWSSYDIGSGDPLGDNYGAEDLSPATLLNMLQDCASFEQENEELLAQAYEHCAYTPESAGHDFWLTRNGHGAGFWDRGLGDVGEKLAAACRGKEFDLYVGDDEKIHA